MKKIFLLSATVLLIASFFNPISTEAKENKLLFSQQVPQKVCKGLVVDTKNVPVIGATVQISGTNTGTITDQNGNFILDGINNGTKLVVKCIGFKDKSVIYEGKDLTITLEEDTKLLDEVVVVGYGSIRKADVAGSIATMDDKALRAQPLNQLSDAFQGKISGVQIQNSNIPGGEVTIRVRGANSVNLGNEPLVVVDGVVRDGGMNGLNPTDIKSIQVLKDASSTAIYGSRGANGVILITTQTGKSGQRIISFEAQEGFSFLPRRIDILSPYDYAVAQNEFAPGTYDEQALNDLKSGKKGVDWQKEIFRTGRTRDVNFIISNGDEKTQYYLSGRYINQEGILKYTDSERYSARLNVNSKVTDKFHISADIELNHSIKNGNNIIASKSDNAILAALNQDPTIPIYDNIETKTYYKSGNINNPLALLESRKARGENSRVYGNLVLRYEILKGLTFSSTNGLNFTSHRGFGFGSKRFSPVTQFASMSNSANQGVTLQSSNNLTYIGSFDKHNITATAVWEATTSEWKQLNINGNQLYTENVGWWNVSLANQRNAGNSFSKSSLLSAVGRFIYSYDNRYNVTLTFRADGSSKFQNKKWGFFPSLALAWDISNEAFMKDVEWVNQLKLRTSYGVIGNQNIGPFSTLGLLGKEQTNYGQGSGLFTGYWPTKPSTPALTWEKTHQFDLGFDGTFFNNLLNVTFDYFNKNTVDALMEEPITDYNGGGSYLKNIGKVNNTGFDFSIGLNLFRDKEFNWSTNVTGTYLKNVVKDLGSNKQIFGKTPADKMADQSNVTMVGYTIGSFYGYVWNGINKNGENTYKDLNNDGTIDGKDRKVIGKPIPTFTLGWNNTFSYKNWDLNIFFTGAFGVDRLNLVEYTIASKLSDFPYINSVPGYKYNFDINPSNAKYASIKHGGDNKSVSTKWLQDASYFRLSNLTLGYNIPNKLWGVGVKLVVSAQNLFTITKYSGYDPTSFAFTDSYNKDQTNGVDVGGYPSPRSIFIGVKLNF